MATLPANRAYSDFVDFIIERVSASEILAFKASAAAEERVTLLLERLKNEKITPDEKAELDQMAQIDLLVGMLKARAFAESPRE